MRRPELLFLAPLSVLASWIAVQAHDIHVAAAARQRSALVAEEQEAPAPVHNKPKTRDPAIVSRARDNDLGAGEEAAPGTVRPSREPAPLRDLGEIRRRLVQNVAGTYIGDILAARDSNIARWPDRTSRPLRVWIQPTDTAHDWNPANVDQVRDAFTTWVAAGSGVPFTFVTDSASADVHVTWVVKSHFEEQISGKTMWARNENWWIVDANIAIALHRRITGRRSIHEPSERLRCTRSGTSSASITARTRRTS